MSIFTSEGEFIDVDIFRVNRHFETSVIKKRADEPLIRKALWRVCNNCFCNVRCYVVHETLPDHSVKINPSGKFDKDSRCWFNRVAI